MKIKIEIKSRWFGKILFEYEKEDNTIKDTIEAAIKQGADLTGAYLKGADLIGADLIGADLTGADLTGADLKGADLTGADLTGADLTGADLTGAYLKGAYLKGADLTGAYLKGADLTGADLKGAYLKGADLTGADLTGAYLTGAKDIPYIPLACPSDGAFIGWKKVRPSIEYGQESYLVKLEIPEDALRSSATSSKCRCNKAKVLEITSLKTGKRIDIITNTNKKPCKYKVGEMVIPDSFDEDRWNECSHGIHFFINKEEAINY